jgi:hypothetical protein
MPICLDERAPKEPNEISATKQGCQMFHGTTYQNQGEYTKLPEKIDQKSITHTKCPQNRPNVQKYTNIFQRMIRRNLPKFENIPSGNPATTSIR